ncbi:MAG: Gfo/Idh/MocA family oxidoreductase [Planctomycetaceae bacterium]|nr:Gfo/Idh/MocA family oxidoreductase [Planctomycetaceae bacterium]
MDLTPESKEIGRENFRSAIGSSVVRRSFLTKGIQKGISSGNGLGPYYYGYSEKVERPLRVGVIGTGDEGSVLINALNPKYVEVVAIADIRPYNVWRAFHGDYDSPVARAARCGLMEKYGWKTEDEAKKHVKVYGPYQDLLENAEADGVEAVIIALPLHLHAAAAIAAMKKGLHVLTEKLMGHSVHECKEMARIAKATGKHLATGHQRHYNILYDNAVHAINAGLLGDIHYIRAQWHRGNLPGSDSWQQPMPREFKPEDVQAGKIEKELESWEKKLAGITESLAKEKNVEKKASLAQDKELWTNKVAQKKAQLDDKQIADQVEKYGYERLELKDGDGRVLYNRPAGEELIRWRLWDRTGGGLMAELGSHQLDAASIFVSAMHGGKKQYPLNVFAAASRSVFPADRDAGDHVFCMFEYPAPDYDPGDELKKRKKITVSYASINGNGFAGYGETVFGTKGTLLLETEKDAMLFKTHYVDDKTVVKGGLGSASLEILDSGDKPAAEEQEVSSAVGFHATAGDISRGYTEQIEHWVCCIRENPEAKDDGPLPHCHPKVAIADAVIALTTNLAAAGPGRIDFKKEWFDIDSDETPEGVKPNVSKYS